MKIQRYSSSGIIVEGAKRVDRCGWGCEDSPKKSGRRGGPEGWLRVVKRGGHESKAVGGGGDR
jgi:hypothetical protein